MSKEPSSISNLCIIPARGGSKRIPRKNIKHFMGKPIIAYSIEVASASGLFDEVMVSTDDTEIARIAGSFGASIPFMRSNHTADDFATTVEVVKEVLEMYKRRGRHFDSLCVIYPTAPLLSIDRIKEGYQALKTHSAAIPVVEFDFPVWRSFKIENNQLFYQWPEFEKQRSQDLQPLYHDAGQWYWIRVECINDTLVPANTCPIYLKSYEVHDIDTETDWCLAELKYSRLKQSN